MGFKFSLRELFGLSAREEPEYIITPSDYEKTLMTVRYAQVPSLEIPAGIPEAARRNLEEMREINRRGLLNALDRSGPKF